MPAVCVMQRLTNVVTALTGPLVGLAMTATFSKTETRLVSTVKAVELAGMLTPCLLPIFAVSAS